MTVELHSHHGVDACWLASDLQGRVGAFVTGGSGPIPQTALPWIGNTEEQVLELPVSSSAEMVVRYLRPDDFVELASRGIYAFDWTDVHKAAKSVTGMYELVCRPSKPIAVEQLPLALQSAARSTQIDTAFGNTPINLAAL